MLLNRPIGIDLGTTNSAVAMLHPNEHDLVLFIDSQGRRTVPSCVWRDPKTGEAVVGHRAYARRGTSRPPISSIKRKMGTQMTVPFGDEQRAPAAISSLILRELKTRMEEQLAANDQERRYVVDRAIVTVPAYFSLPAIEATREAGRQAGLDVLELLHEPTAAAIYYSWKHDLGDGIYLVYDLGGGTFDASVLQRTGGEFAVLGISGDNFLGGDEFDRLLAEHLRTLLVADGYELELDLEHDPGDVLRFEALVALAENLKKDLSDKDEVLLRDQGSLQDKAGTPVVIELTVTRSTFESLIDALVERTIQCCREALEKAKRKSGITLANVNHVLLVGGSTYVPLVMEKVRRAFCAEDAAAGERAACERPIRDEPETAVALGAALRAAAAGMGVIDGAQRVRIWFAGAGATRRARTTIHGTVDPLVPDVVLEGGSLQLVGPGGEVIARSELGPDRRFAFPGVELELDAVNRFRIEVFDAFGRPVVEYDHAVVHDPNRKQAVGRTLSTAVLSKPIVLEGTDGDRRVQQVLLAEGTSLPARATFSFSVADPSGRIRLPIYQENRIIKELSAEVGAVEAGTPVKIEIACDELVNIRVECSIAERSFGGEIEPPPPDAVPTEYEIAVLQQRLVERLRRLEPTDQEQIGQRFGRVVEDLHEARRGADYAKLIQRAADLEGLIRDAQDAEPLSPALSTVEETLRQCRELLPRAVEVRPDVAGAFSQHLEQAAGAARTAYAARDRQRYADAVQAIDTGHKFLIGITRSGSSNLDEVDLAVRASMMLDEVRRMAQFLQFVCLAQRDLAAFANVSTQVLELDELEERIGESPQDVIARCQVLSTEFRRLYQQLRPDDRGESELRGLLRVDGRAPAAVDAGSRIK